MISSNGRPAALMQSEVDAGPEQPQPEAATRDREIEAKFRLGPEADLPRLASAGGLPAGFEAGPQHIALIEDVYVDTEARALMRAGFALRLRHAGGKVKLTLKGIDHGGHAAIHDRFELESQVEPGFAPLDPAGWTPGLRQQVLAATGKAPRFLPLVNIGHARLTRPIFGPGPVADGEAATASGPIAEWVLEELRVSRPDREGLRAGIPEGVGDFVEAELELLEGGQREQLEQLSAHWLAQPGVSAESASKLEQALRMLAERPTQSGLAAGLQPPMGMAEAGRLLLRQQLTEMLLCEGGAREGADIEYVHDMRVACRRASGLLDLFGDWIEPEQLAPLARLFKRTRRALGPIRDLDVALEKLTAHQAELSKSEAKALEAVAKRWRKERAAANPRMLAWLDSRRYARLIARAEQLLERPEAEAEPGPEAAVSPWQLRHVMPGAIQQRYSAVRAYEVPLADLARVPDDRLHELRIDCKRLRYCLESVLPLIGPAGEEAVRRVKRVQTTLGDFNDALVKRALLDAMIADGIDAPAVKAYAKLQTRQARKLRAGLAEHWAPVCDREMRELIGDALAAL